jgi:seryl-tRNA synthetase
VTGSRTIVALLENGQQADGSIVLPDALVAVGAPKTLPAAA